MSLFFYQASEKTPTFDFQRLITIITLFGTYIYFTFALGIQAIWRQGLVSMVVFGTELQFSSSLFGCWLLHGVKA